MHQQFCNGCAQIKATGCLASAAPVAARRAGAELALTVAELRLGDEVASLDAEGRPSEPAPPPPPPPPRPPPRAPRPAPRAPRPAPRAPRPAPARAAEGAWRVRAARVEGFGFGSAPPPPPAADARAKDQRRPAERTTS